MAILGGGTRPADRGGARSALPEEGRIRSSMRVEDSTFLVTGGGSGLGAATARSLAETGANVLIADLSEEASEGMVPELGENTCFVQADVTDEASVQNAVDAALENFGALHGAVNCAGVAIA